MMKMMYNRNQRVIAGNREHTMDSRNLRYGIPMDEMMNGNDI